MILPNSTSACVKCGENEKNKQKHSIKIIFLPKPKIWPIAAYRSVLLIYRKYWCHYHMPALQWPRTALRARRVKIWAMSRVPHSIHVSHFCPNSYTAIQVLALHRAVLLALDLSPNLLNDLRDLQMKRGKHRFPPKHQWRGKQNMRKKYGNKRIVINILVCIKWKKSQS